jgi:hypothetical protein
MSERVKLRVADETKTAPEANQPKESQGKKPTKALPTVRVSFMKQMDILRAYAAASGGVSKIVSLKEVADIVPLAVPTVSLANPFFVDVRFVQRSEGVGMTPANELLEYAHAYQWDKETAAHKLAPLLSKTWFWVALQPRLDFQELSEDQVVTLLSEKASAGPIYKSQLRMILEYLDAAGMVKRANGVVTAVKGRQRISSSASTAESPEKVQPAESTEARAMPSQPQQSAVATNFAQTKQGSVNFDISVHIDMAEFAGWQPARIAAFFSGIAQVLSAKGMVEKESGSRE